MADSALWQGAESAAGGTEFDAQGVAVPDAIRPGPRRRFSRPVPSACRPRSSVFESTAPAGGEVFAISDTDIVSQAVVCQRVAVMVAAKKNRCLPGVAWLKPIERLSGSLLNVGRDDPWGQRVGL